MNQPTNDVLNQLTLLEIASWQVPEAADCPPKILATLPALQRGAVWKPKQIENLWDSLMRGFPVGSFLVASFAEERLGKQAMQNAPIDDDREYTHYLLDGQQRATAIALGFVDPIIRKTPASLWLDLYPSIDNTDDREFVFRVINQFHPWGFSRTNAENRLEVKEIRAAFKAFKLASKNTQDEAKPFEFPLMHAWPWDAVAPIPVPFLWGVSTRDELLKKLERLPYWKSQNPPEWKTKVEAAVSGKDEKLAQILDHILIRFAELKDYEIPVLTVPMNAKTPEYYDKTERPDHIETLFVRVNSGGTQLEGEELIYSIYKSEWPEALKLIDKLHHRLTSPARTVVLATRLILARAQIKQGKLDRQPPVPNVSMFRRLLRGADKEHPEFKDELRKAFSLEKEENGAGVFKAVHTFLTWNSQDPYRLPPYLAADLARGQAGHEVMILLLRWADRLLEDGIDPASLDDTRKRRTLGFITALAWFSVDIKECVHRLWPDLQQCNVTELKDFFTANRFKSLIRREESQGVILIPPITSLVFYDALHELCETVEQTALSDKNSFYWKSANFYHIDSRPVRQVLARWMETAIYPLWQENQRGEDVEAWWIDRIWADRKFVIYAQRDWLMRWFPCYDPTIPGAADTNRPWDYDHIHPNNYVAGRWNLPSFLRHLHWSNGNFRAWPLEANRSDHDNTPSVKLTGNPYEECYKLKSEDLLAASFISEAEEVQLWCASVPPDGNNVNYLSDPQKYRENHLSLVYAITKRLGRVYAEWFDSLNVGDLLPK